MEEKRLLTFDEAGEYLDEVAAGIPDEIFGQLNGGIVLLPDVVISPHAVEEDLYTMGTYNHEPYGMGRYIAINYGSFERVYKNASVEAQKKALKDVLYHELTHHLESLAGVRDLEVVDETFIEGFRKQREKGGKGPDSKK